MTVTEFGDQSAATEKMDETAGVISTGCNILGTELENLQEIFGGMQGYWMGRSADTFFSEAVQCCDEIEQFVSVLSSYSEKLKDIAVCYRSADEHSTDQVDALPGNLL